MLTIEEIQAELQEEIDLCNKYFIEEDMHKESTEHERLALKIITMCMQTLSALNDEELEDYKYIKQWKSEIMDSFCKYDVSSFEELIANARNKAIDDFIKSEDYLMEKIKEEKAEVSIDYEWRKVVCLDDIRRMLHQGLLEIAEQLKSTCSKEKCSLSAERRE